MALNMQQQIIIAARGITYDNDREAMSEDVLIDTTIHYYARENLQVIEETRLWWEKVTVWAMIVCKWLLGMRILDERYSDIVDEIFVPAMQSAEQERYLFQQDAVPTL